MLGVSYESGLMRTQLWNKTGRHWNFEMCGHFLIQFNVLNVFLNIEELIKSVAIIGFNGFLIFGCFFFHKIKKSAYI
jgi:hypothetical protein